MKELLSAPLSPRKLVEYLLLFLLLASVLSAAAYGGYWYGKGTTQPATSQGSSSKQSPQSRFPGKPSPKLTEETADWKTYRDKQYGFEFKYPQNFQETEGLGQYFLDQKPVIELENEYFNYLTNQINAYFTVSVKSNAKSECEYIPRGVVDTLKNKLINGVNFTVFSAGGAATGNTYSNTVLHYLKDPTCYEIVTTIHEASDGNNPEALPKINEQKARLESQLDQILSTFRFLTAESSSGGTLAIPPEFPTGDFYTCNSHGDCVSVDAGYCGCSEGGKATAINKDHIKKWEKQWQVEGNPQVFCSQVMSTDPTCSMVPRCIEKRCRLLEKGEFCGGFMGKACPVGYHCVYDGHYPDASGTCQKN